MDHDASFVKLMTESHRERETFRQVPPSFAGSKAYYHLFYRLLEDEAFLLLLLALPANYALFFLRSYDHNLTSSHYRYVRDGYVPPSSELATAADSILTGLAQLGAFQTGTDRALISLFDSTHQYIIAEATPSIRIAAGTPGDGCPIGLARCGTAVPRHQAACDHILNLSPTPNGVANGKDLPLSLVPNLTDDARFSSLPYCRFPSGKQFYAGVPIRTRKGINIGSYCVMSLSKPSGWNEQHEQRLRDISHAVMEHLELKRTSYENIRHERFAKGLGAFMVGKGANKSPSRSPSRSSTKSHVKTHAGALRRRDSDEMESQHEYGVPNDRDSIPRDKTTHTYDMLPPSYRLSNSKRVSSVENPCAPSQHPVPDKLKAADMVFSDAARIIQETFDVDGCVFLDVAPSSHRQVQQSSCVLRMNNMNHGTDSTSFTSSSDEQGSMNGEPIGGVCEVLGRATIWDSEVDAQRLPDHTVSSMPKRLLAKLLRRYPNGKVFNFDTAGVLQPSDSSEDDGAQRNDRATDADPLAPSRAGTQSAEDQQRKRTGRIKVASLIQKAFPHARSVMFVPIWDPKKLRWLSGGFVYSVAPTRFFSTQNELSLLLAFSKVISIEILNMETRKNEKAKSDALGSLSHELRSPLHGVILSTEMLNETDLSVYQRNATHTIETCCRTLIDTIDHLLDFSKVNSFAPSSHHRRLGSTSPRNSLSPKPASMFGKKSLYKHLRLDGLVEDVVVSVFAGFNFERLSPERFGPLSNSKSSFSNPNAEIKPAEEWLRAFERQAAVNERPRDVSVYVTADPTCNWMLYVQAGAVRRIIMNLLGNSLKHTTSGTIKVTLSQETSKASPEQSVIKLTVADTGNGISEDFLQHSLFKPFCQEDALSPGIGLGLSLVKKMVAQLRGRITVRSHVGVGTTVQVTLPHDTSVQAPLAPGDAALDDDKSFDDQVKELTGLRIGIKGFGAEWGSDGRQLVDDICCRWLNLRLAADEGASPDIILISEDALAESSPGNGHATAQTPMIVVCRDALSAWRLSKAYETIDARRVIEFVSQPIAPRVLGRAIIFAYQRWTGLPELVLMPRPQSLQRAIRSGSEQHSPLLPAADPQPPVAQFEALSPFKTNGSVVAEAQVPPAQKVSVVDTPLPEKVDCLPVKNAEGRGKLLLVDDNRINLKVLSAIMAKLGHDYEVAMNGQEAVDAYLRCPGKPAGVLMDISMPVMDGLEATRLIREHERKNGLPAVPVLALTGLSSDETHREALESGVNVFLTKPVKFKTICDALKSVGISSH